MFRFLRRKQHRRAGRASEDAVVVTFDDDLIQVVRPQGHVERVRWDELGAVLIETTDEGPLAMDFFWILMGRGATSGCIVPGGATGEKELLKALQTRLPHFDNANVIEAMGSTENVRFLIWERDRSAPPT